MEKINFKLDYRTMEEAEFYEKELAKKPYVRMMTIIVENDKVAKAAVHIEPCSHVTPMETGCELGYALSAIERKYKAYRKEKAQAEVRQRVFVEGMINLLEEILSEETQKPEEKQENFKEEARQEEDSHKKEEDIPKEKKTVKESIKEKKSPGKPSEKDKKIEEVVKNYKKKK